MNGKKNIRVYGGGLAAFLIVVAIAIAVNILASGMRARIDLTEEKVYTLSEGSRATLKDLPGPVTLKFFFNFGDAEAPMMIKNFARRVEDLLREYEADGKGKVIVEKFDPKPDSDSEDWARRYGVTGQSIGLVGPQVYLGLVAVMGDREAVIPVLDPQTENLMEYNVTRLIATVAHAKKPVVGVLSGLPILGGPPPMDFMGGPRQRPKPAWMAFGDLKEMFEVRNLDTAIEAVPEDVDALVLVHPKDLPDRTLFALDQFVLRGGRLIAFLDAMCVSEQESSPMPGMQMSPGPSNLEKLLSAWGVVFEGGKIACDLAATTRLRGQGDRVEESPVWLSLRRKNFSAGDVLTTQLESIMMPFAGTFAKVGTNDVEVLPLITTSETSGLVDGMAAQFGFDAVKRDFASGGKPMNLAVRVRGKLKTAFPGGQPKAADDTNTAAVAASPAGLLESKDKVSVVLVGDVDMLADRFTVTEINFLGSRGFQPINDNIGFLLNAIEQASGSANLAAIRTRGKTSRPFDYVLELERRAQERFMQQEIVLQKKLEDTQRRLGELQDRKDQSQQMILSPEQKAEIERFRKDEYETRKELKLVRRKLREDIESLGVGVKAVNILLVPLLVVIAGIGIGMFRKNRR